MTLAVGSRWSHNRSPLVESMAAMAPVAVVTKIRLSMASGAVEFGVMLRRRRPADEIQLDQSDVTLNEVDGHQHLADQLLGADLAGLDVHGSLVDDRWAADEQAFGLADVPMPVDLDSPPKLSGGCIEAEEKAVTGPFRRVEMAGGGHQVAALQFDEVHPRWSLGGIKPEFRLLSMRSPHGMTGQGVHRDDHFAEVDEDQIVADGRNDGRIPAAFRLVFQFTPGQVADGAGMVDPLVQQTVFEWYGPDGLDDEILDGGLRSGAHDGVVSKRTLVDLHGSQCIPEWCSFHGECFQVRIHPGLHRQVTQEPGCDTEPVQRCGA